MISESETEIRQLVLIGLEPVPWALLFLGAIFYDTSHDYTVWGT